MFVSEVALTAHRQTFPGQGAAHTAAGDVGHSRAVIDLVGGRDAGERHILAVDVGGGGQSARGGQVVVAPVACAVGLCQGRDIGHGDCFVVGRIGVRETARATDGQGFCTYTGVDDPSRDAGGVVAVIDLVGCGDAVQRHILAGDVGLSGHEA